MCGHRRFERPGDPAAYSGAGGGIPSINTAAGSSFTVAADLIDLDGPIQFGFHDAAGRNILGFTDANNQVLVVPTVVDAPGFKLHRVQQHGRRSVRQRIAFGRLSHHPGGPDLSSDQRRHERDCRRNRSRRPISTINQSNIEPRCRADHPGNGRTPPPLPASVFERCCSTLPTTIQDGVVRAPLGTIFFNQKLERGGGFRHVPERQHHVGQCQWLDRSVRRHVGRRHLQLVWGLLQPLGVTSTGGASGSINGIGVGGTSITVGSGALLDLPAVAI